MKFSVIQKNFKRGLMITSCASSRNINLPILNNVMISAVNGEIKLIATDLEIGVVYLLRGKIEEEGNFTVNLKTINSYVSLLPNEKIEVRKKGEKLEIECGAYKTKIGGQGTEEFPLIPKIEKKDAISIDAEELKQALIKVSFATANNETRLELSGVLFSFERNRLNLAATDGYRLAEKNISVKNPKEDSKTIIPIKTVNELVKIISALSEDEEVGRDKNEVKIYFSESQVLFEIGSTELVSKVIDGQFPDYKQIIPQNIKTIMILDKNEASRAIKASALFSQNDINDIKISYSKNGSIISSAGQEGESRVEVKGEISGEEGNLVLNFRYLLDGINNIAGEKIKIEIVDGNAPCILRSEKEDRYLYIIMPIKQ